jgi:hypothetical protein
MSNVNHTENAQHHLHWTYRQLRVISGSVLIVIPVAIVLVAWLQYGFILPTLSHYYFSEVNPSILRTSFTGFLILVGGIMICYRGFDDLDNWLHNIAGVAAICVAVFPKTCDTVDGDRCVESVVAFLHLPSAVVMFAAAALAVLYGGGKSFKNHLSRAERLVLRRWRFFSLVGMASGISIYIPYLLGISALPLTGVLIVEMAGFFGFALYWIGMTHVIYRANQRGDSPSSIA